MSTSTSDALFGDLQVILDGDRDQVWSALDVCIASINEVIEKCLNKIIHHPKFQQLERMWVGLARVIDAVGDIPMVKMEVLDLSKEGLLEDFEEYLDLSDSGMFQQLYTTEYDQAGGEPYAGLLMQYEFTTNAADLYLLKMLSNVAASCHCPAIGNVGPSFFRLRDYTQLEDVEDFDLLFQNPEFTKWRQFRETEDARYVALMLPRILIRTPYDNHIFESFRFTEECHDVEDHAWSFATYGFAVLMAKSFEKHGWCVHIRGPQTGGVIDVVPGMPIGCKGFDLERFPLELAFSDFQEHKLSDQGLIVLNYFKAMKRICVFTAPTVQCYTRGTSKKFTSNDRLAASLPYIFLVSRIAHYQKVIQRENIGTVKESKQLEIELHNWLSKLITKMPDPDMDIRCRYPLRGGQVTVDADEENPGFFNVNLILQPHLQLEGINAELTLVSKLPRKKE